MLLGLRDDPFPGGYLKLTGLEPPKYRLRVGEYRIIYSVSVADELIVIDDIARRTTQTYEGL